MDRAEEALSFSALRSGSLTLHRITQSNSDEVRALLRDSTDLPEIIREFDASYQPAYDASGRCIKWGFYATLDNQLAGLSLLGISSWRDLRGYTGADTLPHMRGLGVAPNSKPHLFYLGFQLLGLNRIETGCFVSNVASRRSIEKTLGFKFEGVLREYGRSERGQMEDELRYSILRRDWLQFYAETKVKVIP